MQLCLIFLSTISLTLLFTHPADGTFPHALGGLVTDIAVNPLGILAIIILKKLILLKLGLLLLGKRSIDEPISSTTENPTEMSSSDYENMAASLDANGCIARLICEIIANKDGSGKFEKAIVDYFSGEDVPVGKSVFHYAAFMGKRAKSSDTCGMIFQKCERAMSEVRKTARVAFDLDV